MKKIFLIYALLSSVVFASIFVSAPHVAVAEELNCAILPQDLCNAAKSGADKVSGDVSKTGIFSLLTLILNVLTGLVGVVAVAVFVYAGILYSSAGADAGRVSQAKKLITDAAIGLLAYAIVFFVLNWLIPGGIFG